MSESSWTYMLRIPHRNPNQMPMERLADYMREFALLLGVENTPVFAGIKKASVGIKAKIPPAKRAGAWRRVQLAKTDPKSAPAKNMRTIEGMLGNDLVPKAELLDTESNVVYLFQPPEKIEFSQMVIKQHGEIDGVVTGLVGADDTMHLHIRDAMSRDLKFIVRSETMARELLSHFRKETLRLHVHGSWLRTEAGWVPENNKCVVDSYELLDDTSAADLFKQISELPGNGWCDLEDPAQVWRDLRGLH